MNPYIAEPAASDRTTCARCHNRIGLSSLRLRLREAFWSNQSYFHLRCFRPLPPVPMELGKTLVVSSANEQHIAQAKKWIDKWNSQFKPNSASIPAIFTQKQVLTESSPRLRLWLEVLIFLPSEELELALALTCKELFHVTREEEVWRRKLMLEGNSTLSADGSYRSDYIKTIYERCARCKVKLSITDIAFKCPLRKRPVCNQCQCFHGYKPETLNSFCKTWKITENLLKRLQVPIFRYMHSKSLYREDCIRLVLPYFATRLKLLMTDVEKHRELFTDQQWQQIHALTESSFFLVTTICEQMGHLVHIFCGKDDQKESIEQSLAAFYSSIPST